MKMPNTKKLILGSKSPRRSQLLREAGFDFEIRIQDIDENFDPLMPLYHIAENLAERKAIALQHTLIPDEILLTADSVVILYDTIYNKPDNYDEGVHMLSALSGRTHDVATGVCLQTLEKKMLFTVVTKVSFALLSASEIDYYLKSYEPYDKAGAYGIQDWIGLCKVSKIEGSYSNVMGLPVKEVYDALVSMGYIL